jgi:hypothetical protein
MNPTGARRLRAVTNCDVSSTDMETVLSVVEEVLDGKASSAAALPAAFYR